MGELLEAIRLGFAAGQFFKWDHMKQADLDKYIEEFKGGSHKEDVSNACSYIKEHDAYKEDKKDVGSYKICCEMVDYCSFYVQTWFYLVCAGAVLLLIIIGIVISCCCCCKNRGGGGKDVEAIDKKSTEDTE